MAERRTKSHTVKLLRSRLFLVSGLELVLAFALVVLVPRESGKLALVLLGITCAVPLLTLSLSRQVAHRTRAEIGGKLTVLAGQIHDLQGAHEKFAQRLADIIEHGRQQEEQRWSDNDATQRRLGEGLLTVHRELRRSWHAMESLVEQVKTDIAAGDDATNEELANIDRQLSQLHMGLRELAPSTSDQLAITRASVQTSRSAMLVHAGVGAADFCTKLACDSATVVNLDEQADPRPCASEVDSLVVVGGSFADLRWIAETMESFPEASRVLIAVLRSTRAFPLPTAALPHDDQVARFQVVRGTGHGWTADILLHRRATTAEFVQAVARLAGTKPLAAHGGAAVSNAADIRLVNPVGFRTDPTEGMASFAHGGGKELTIVSGERTLLRVSTNARITEADIATLRPFRGLSLDFCENSPAHGSDDAAQQVCAAVVPALASAGIPLCGMDLPPGLRRNLDSRLADLIASATPQSLEDPLAREEHSIRLRRIGLSSRVGSSPPLTVIMCTRREEMVPFALEQLKGQRGVDFEVVVGLHGAWLEPAKIRQRAESEFARCHVVEIPAEVPFGDALNRLAAVASGSLLVKMDDDDWYGSDFLSDLLLARSYSEADVVGTAAEFVFLEELDTTARRVWRTEVFGQNVSGGALMIGRPALEAVNGFRALGAPGPEDALIQEDVKRAGGSIYRSHGLNYVLRRRPSGHTWQVDSDYFLQGTSQTWPGLHPSSLFGTG
jgi:hypothetical protein